MEYIRPKLQINRYKKDRPHILFRKLASEVDRETQMKLNFSLGYDLALWLVRLMSFNPKYNIEKHRLFERDAVDALIKDYLQIVSDPDNLFVAIVKMQVYYMNNYIDKNRIIEKHRNVLDEKMRPLTRSIISTQLKSKKECDEYLKKLAVDIIAHYALGSPENAQVVQETINALKSMMSTNDVIAFSTLSEKDKIESYSGIREIVCGMRAFNKDAGHCGEGLIDIEKTVRNGYKTTKLQLNVSLKELTDRIDSLVKPCAKLLALNMQTQLAECNNIAREITLIRQCERFLCDLFNTLADHQVYIESYLRKFRIQLNKIHEIVKFRTAIPITSIFPKFIELTKLWEQLQHQTYILSEMNTVNGQLMAMVQNQLHSSLVKDLEAALTSTSTSNHGADNGFNKDKTIPSTSQKGDEPKIMNTTENNLIKIIPYEANITKIQYDAFCTWTLSAVNGLLMPSDLTIGLVQYKNQCYAFRSVVAANLFIQDPDTCLQSIHNVIGQNGELVVFFDMYNWLKPHSISMEQFTRLGEDGHQHVCDSFEQQCSIGIQTDVHPIPYAKDTNYVWNLWDLRRMAVKLANIQKCKTKSTQTYCSSSFGTQTNYKLN